MEEEIKRGILICPCGQVKFVDEDSWKQIDDDTRKYLLEKVKQEVFIKYDVKCPNCDSITIQDKTI